MSSAQSITHFERNAEKISVRVVTDPPGRSETPPMSKPRVAIHLGSSVYMVCERGGQRHGGLAVHGDIDIVPAGTSCLWEPDGPDTALIVGIDPAVLTSVAEDLGLSKDRLEVVNRFQVRDPQIEHICWALKVEMETGYPCGRIFLDSLSTALAASLVRRHSSLARVVPFPSSINLRAQNLRQTLSYIDDNVKRDLSLSEIAKIAGVSVSQLKTKFRQLTGVTVHQYVISRRIERATVLLAQSRLSISEVAQETGFAHQSHLARHMQRMLGCSPRALRQHHR